jgi:hypothetical protein
LTKILYWTKVVWYGLAQRTTILTMTRTKARFYVVPCTLIFLTGCISLNNKFMSGVSADIGFFTDTTVKMMQEVNFGFTREGILYTKKYWNPKDQEELDLAENTADADRVLKAIVRYSMRLVTITEANDSEKDQIKAYADYLEVVDIEVVNKLGLEQGFYNSVIKKVREQHDLLGALRAAQPIINAVGLYMQATLDEVTEASDVLDEKLDKKILEHYADTIRYQDTLEREKASTLKALECVYLTNHNDLNAYKALLASDQIRDPKLIPKGKPSYDQLVKMADYLMQRFKVQHEISREVEPEWLQFKATQKEREYLHAKVQSEVKQFLMVTLTWVRAHQKMSSGKAKPAEWFDINEAAIKGLKAGIDLAL